MSHFNLHHVFKHSQLHDTNAISLFRDDHPSHATHRAKLAYIGRPDDESGQPGLDAALSSYVPLLKALLEEGKLKPNEVTAVPGGFEAVASAVELQLKSPGGKKVFVELQSP